MITSIDANGIVTYSGEDVQDLRVINSGNKYAVTDATKPNFGKTFSRCQLNGVVFTVNDDDEMLAWRKANDLFMIKVKESDETVDVVTQDAAGAEVHTPTRVKRYALVGARSMSASIASRTAVVHYDSITVENFVPKTVAQLEALAD
jgi:hypothetical protein